MGGDSMRLKEKQVNIAGMVNKIINSRNDLSSSLTHLTKDCNGYKAKENLISILTAKKIEARNPDCFQKHKLLEGMESAFKVLSFTETPYEELKNVVNVPFKRKIELKGYGVAFSREEIIRSKGVPVYYLYQKEQQTFFSELMDTYIEQVRQHGMNESDPLLSILPYIKEVSEREDFHWEREWKIRGDFSFTNTPTILVPTKEEAYEIFNVIFESGKSNFWCFYLVEENEFIYFSFMKDWPDRQEGDYIILKDIVRVEGSSKKGYPLDLIEIIEKRQSKVLTKGWL